jgi:hypothetical protein
MYEEVMQLIALAKNDEQYFKRIDDLKQKQLELAHVMEIAKTLGEADMHLAKARQSAAEIVKDAEKSALEIKSSAETFVSEAKQNLEKTKEKQKVLKEKEASLDEKEKSLKVLEKTMEESIAEHRKLTALRTVEMEEAQKVRALFESKLKQIREIAAQK